jgi:hypothetical protein
MANSDAGAKLRTILTLAQDPSALQLDEATNVLNAKTERVVQQSLYAWSRILRACRCSWFTGCLHHRDERCGCGVINEHPCTGHGYGECRVPQGSGGCWRGSGATTCRSMSRDCNLFPWRIVRLYQIRTVCLCAKIVWCRAMYGTQLIMDCLAYSTGVKT